MTILNRDIFLDQNEDNFDSDQWFEAGVPANGAGCIAALMVRVLPTDPLPTISIGPIPNADGQIVFDTLGNVSRRITKSAAQRLGALTQQGVFEIALTSLDGTPISFAKGAAVVSPATVF